MKLVDMQMSKSEVKEFNSPIASEAPRFPYGLRLNLEEGELEKLGLSKLPAVGETMKLEAEVEVCTVSSYDSSEGGERRSLSLQIVSMGLGADKSDASDVGEKLYGKK